MTLYLSTRRSQSTGSNLRWMTTGLAQRLRDAHEPARTRVVQRAGRDVDVVGRVADQPEQCRRPGPGPRHWCAARPSACRSCPTCRSSWRPVRRCRAARARGRRRLDEGVDLGHAGRRLAVEHEDVLDLGDVRADLLEERRELGVDVDDRRVAVVGDVRRLLVVTAGSSAAPPSRRSCGPRSRRSRCRASSGRTTRLCDPGPAPCWIRTLAELVGPRLELGERPSQDRAVRPIVDDRELVGLACA